MTILIRRREFFTILGSTVGFCPIPISAASSEKASLVAVLLGLSEQDPEAKHRIKEFRLGMRDLEWLEGRNVRVEYRFGKSDLDLINKHVEDLINLKPAVIVANSTPVLAAFRRATTTIPIVYVVVNDPIGQGFISNLANPGGNITGFSFLELEIVGKWATLLREIKPDLARAALMFNPDTAGYYDRYLKGLKALPDRAPIDIDAVHVRNLAEVEAQIARLAQVRNAALMLAGDPFVLSSRGSILESANTRLLATISPYRQFAEEGSLLSYGPDTGDIFRRSSSYVDRILRGASPGNLPAQSPIRFDLTINLKVAKALGLSPQTSLLQLADHVVE